MLQYTIDRCEYLIGVRAYLERKVRQYMDAYWMRIQFLKEDGNIKSSKEVTRETKNLIEELLQTKGMNLIKTGTIIQQDRTLTIWRYQMELTYKVIDEYHLRIDMVMRVFWEELLKKVVFINLNYRSDNILDDEWNQLLKE